MMAADADLRAKIAAAISERDALRAQHNSDAQDRDETRLKSEEYRVAIVDAQARVEAAEKLKCEYENLADDSKRKLEEAMQALDACRHDWTREKGAMEGEKSSLSSRVGELERELAAMKAAGTRNTSCDVAGDDSGDKLAKMRDEVEKTRKKHEQELELKDEQMYKMNLDVSVVRSQMEKETVRMQQAMKQTTENLRREIAELTAAWETSEEELVAARSQIQKMSLGSEGGTAVVDADAPSSGEFANMKHELSRLKKWSSSKNLDAKPRSHESLSFSDDQVRSLVDELNKARSEIEELKNGGWRLQMFNQNLTRHSNVSGSESKSISADAAIGEKEFEKQKVLVELRETNERLERELAESKRAKDDLELLVQQTHAQMQLMQAKQPLVAPALVESGDETDAEFRLKRELRDARERINDLMQQNIKLEAAKSALDGARSRLLTALEKMQGERENLKKEQEKTESKLRSTRLESEAQKERADAATDAARGLLKKIGGLEIDLARTKGDAKQALAEMEMNCQEMREAALRVRQEAGRGVSAYASEKQHLVKEREELRLQIVYMQDSMHATEKRLSEAETELEIYRAASVTSPRAGSRMDTSKMKSFSSSFSLENGLTANILPYNGSNRTSTRNSTSASVDLEDKLKVYTDRNNQLQIEILEYYEKNETAQATIDMQEKEIKSLGEHIKAMEADMSVTQEALRQALVEQSQQKTSMGLSGNSDMIKRETEMTKQISELKQNFSDDTKKLKGRVMELEGQLSAREAELSIYTKQRLGGASGSKVLRLPSSSSRTSSADVHSDLESLTLKLKQSEARLHAAEAELKGLRSSSLLHGVTSPLVDTTMDRALSPHLALGSGGKGPMTPTRTRLPSHAKESLFAESPRLDQKLPKPGAQLPKLAEAYNIESLPPMDHPWEAVRGALCLYDYTAVEVDELSFSHGQRVVILGLAQVGPWIHACMHSAIHTSREVLKKTLKLSFIQIVIQVEFIQIVCIEFIQILSSFHSFTHSCSWSSSKSSQSDD